MRRVVVPLGCVMVLVGCSAVPDPSPSPVVSGVVMPTTVRSPSQTPSPTPTPSSFPSYPADLPTQDPETAAIIAGWQEYWWVYEKFAADPFGFTDFTEINYVTTGTASNETLNAAESLREQRLRSEGGRVFRDVTVERVSDSEATISYCMDIDALRVFEIDSGVQVPRSGTLQEQVTMSRGRDWRVALVRNQWATC